MQLATNGRVDLKSPNTSNLFKMYDKIPAAQCTSYRNPIEGSWESSNLSQAYFSKENINIIQNGIRAGVYEKSNSQYIVEQQDCDALKIIMRSIFLQHAANQPDNIPGQIQALNQMVLNYAVPATYSEAQGYMQYIHDASTLVVPLAPPSMSSTNDKQLEFKGWF